MAILFVMNKIKNLKKMLRLTPLCLFALLSIYLISCETDFDVVADYKDVAIVYGLLNQDDTVHYLRITKAFLGKGNALEYAKNPDSSSYGANILVVLKDSASNGVIKEIVFDTVTLFNKDSGVFYGPNQLFYFAKAQLDKNHSYKLIITNKKTGNIVRSETKLIGDFYFTKPSSAAKSISFKRALTTPGKFTWTNAVNGKKYQLVVRFFYKEFYGINDTVLHSIPWVMNTVNSSNSIGNGESEITFLNEDFFRLCESKIPYADPASENLVLKRYSAYCDLEMTVIDENFSTYLDVNGPSGGVTMEKLQFTNILNGYGLFASRHTIIRRIALNPETIFDLATTTPLKFVKPQ